MGSAVSSAGRGGPTPTIKLLRALRHSQFHSYQSTGLTRERTKMTISCDIPTQMIVDDSSSSSSSPEQTSIKDLEDFASRAMAVNRAVGANSMDRMEPVQVKRAAFSFDLSPPNLSNCGLMARRRRSKENFQRFCSIDEVEPDAFMRTIH